MDPQHQLQLEDAQKKLALFRKHLDLLARCTGESKNIEKDEILSAVAELQTLVEWAAQQPDLGAESAIILVKLQELNHIRENLEKTASTTEKSTISDENNDEENTAFEKSECFSKDLDESDTLTPNSCNTSGENEAEEESMSIDKDSLCDYSMSTEDRNIANAESPESIEDTNIEIIFNDDKLDEIDNSHEKSIVKLTSYEDNFSNRKQTSSENLEAPQIPVEHKTENLELQPTACQLKSPDLYRSEVIIIETDEDNKSVEWINDPKNSNDPLDVCMFAIRNLYESLRAKENELLKLSAMQSDQKQIEALQAVIIDFHKDITNLNSELEKSKKENMLLKEQVLELEEAENDARSEAQKLEQKLVFLQEKDSHSQAELSQLKQSLKKFSDALAEKEKEEKELRSQIKYMETLVQKYEDQIKAMEAKEIEASLNIQTNTPSKCDIEIMVKPESATKGTQMYIFSQSRINRIASINLNNTNINNENKDLRNSHSVENHENITTTASEQSENIDSTTCSIPTVSTDIQTHSSEQADVISFENIENISQKELLKRLHKLIDEDVNLQQQIHYVDEINLAMWKKLQNLDNHIGECKRQNINETNPVVTETDFAVPIYENSEVETSTNENENIPEDFLNNIDQNEHYIQERLNKLKEINASFEKELKTRENLSKEKEKRHEQWIETEKRVINDLNRLLEEKNWIANQINNMKREIEKREKLISQLEQELASLKSKNEEELSKIRNNQEKMIEPFMLRVNQMLIKEKDILKMISNFKLKDNKSQGRSELEKLKCGYIELQLELSQAREEIRKIEEKFKILLDQCAEKNISEENQKSQELERVRNENARCSKLIKDLEENQKDLINALEKQEKYLQEVRENYKKNVEETEEEHSFVETELENQLRLLEEGTAIATTVLKEERLKAEKELQENIKDLKAKEEVYKTRIAELERDVVSLHKELHKITADSDVENSDANVQEKIPDEIVEKCIEILSSKTEISEIAPEILPQLAIDAKLKTPIEAKKKKTSLTVKEENSIETEIEQNRESEKATEENVDELRAQVRELQSHIEKISEDVVDLLPLEPANPITASSLNMQKGDLDYAEVDECCSDAIKKQNASDLNASGSKCQGFYGNKHFSESKTDVQNRKTFEDSLEDNDYDEVLPRPTNFHIVQQVGSDTLLVGWNYVNPSVLEGFEVYVNGQVHERIYIPDRTKALISGLNLKKNMRLSICALSRYGQLSEPTILDVSPQEDLGTNFFNVEEDEYRDFEDPTQNKRPYSMEW